MRDADVVKTRPDIVRRFEGLSASGWVELEASFLRTSHLPRWHAAGSLKGLGNELVLPQHEQFAALLRRSAQKLERTPRWARRVYVVRNARSLDGRELADFLLLAVNNPRDVRRLRAMGVLESKSKGNARAIVYYEGVATGQPEWSAERIREIGLDLRDASIEGEYPAALRREWKPDEIELSLRELRQGAPPLEQTTELIGVVPPDLKPEDDAYIVRRAAERGIQVWRHADTDGEATRMWLQALSVLER